ncbi:hypothetical protein Y048_6025 [Burkholderia pseudomallei MSHR456]|nr:hypothetical protein Y048_6025 [Burkholderia pseudomallei MSHR456]
MLFRRGTEFSACQNHCRVSTVGHWISPTFGIVGHIFSDGRRNLHVGHSMANRTIVKLHRPW